MVGTVVVHRIGNRAYYGALVHLLRYARKIFADPDARDIRRNGSELTAKFGRSVLLHIESVHMGRTTGQKNHDHRLLRRTRTQFVFRLQQSREAHTAHSQGADLQKISPRNSIAKTRSLPFGKHYHGTDFR